MPDLETLLADHALAGHATPGPALATPLAELRATLWRASISRWGPPAGPARSPAPASEQQLLSRLQSGDAAALDAIYAQHAPALLGWARRNLPPEDAEEAMLDAFFVLAEKAAGLDPGRGLRAFLFHVLRRKVIDRQRRQGRLPPFDPLDEELLDPSALREELCRLELQAVARALSTLSPLDQELVVLTAAGHDGPEISARLGLSPDAVRKRLSRARAELRRALQEGAA